MIDIMIYLAADHRGFQLKEAIKRLLTRRSIAFEDVGAKAYAEGDDYVDFARDAAEKVAADPSVHKGVFLCGSGHGVDMVANKFKGVRAVLCWNMQVAKQSRQHEDANVLVLPADWLDEAVVEEVVTLWLGTEFSHEERHVRRLEKIRDVESRGFCKCSGV